MILYIVFYLFYLLRQIKDLYHPPDHNEMLMEIGDPIDGVEVVYEVDLENKFILDESLRFVTYIMLNIQESLSIIKIIYYNYYLNK